MLACIAFVEAVLFAVALVVAVVLSFFVVFDAWSAAPPDLAPNFVFAVRKTFAVAASAVF